MAEGDKEQVGTTITPVSERGQPRVLQRVPGQGSSGQVLRVHARTDFLDNETAEPQYETIEKDELTDKRHHRGRPWWSRPKPRKKENEDGTKETVEVEALPGEVQDFKAPGGD